MSTVHYNSLLHKLVTVLAIAIFTLCLLAAMTRVMDSSLERGVCQG